MVRKLFAPVVLIAALASTSCGYTLAGRGSFLPETIKTIGVPDFDNRTPYFEVGQVLTSVVPASQDIAMMASSINTEPSSV